MEKLFIETTEFTARVLSFLTDDDYSKLQALLRRRPDIGKVMPGCGGMRKLRVADPRRGKGKRGGLRIIYFHVPDQDTIYMVDVYDKSEKDDLDPMEKKRLRQIATACKRTSR